MLSSDFNQIKCFLVINVILTLAIVLKSSTSAPQLAPAAVGGPKTEFSCNTMKTESCLE